MLAELFLLVYTTLAITYSPVTDSTFPLAKSLQFGFGVALYLALFSRGTFFNGYLSADAFGTYIKVLTLLTTCYIATRSPYLMRGQEYPLMFALCTLFLLLMVSSHHLLGTFFAIIGFSLCLYILILFDAPYAAAREAGIKYFYLSTFSTGVMLYGIFLLSTLTPSLQYEDIAQALAKTTSHIARFGCFFTLAGFFFKLSAFPGQL